MILNMELMKVSLASADHIKGSTDANKVSHINTITTVPVILSSLYGKHIYSDANFSRLSGKYTICS
jgi:hypothetical protein